MNILRYLTGIWAKRIDDPKPVAECMNELVVRHQWAYNQELAHVNDVLLKQKALANEYIAYLSTQGVMGCSIDSSIYHAGGHPSPRTVLQTPFGPFNIYITERSETMDMLARCLIEHLRNAAQK
jgi:hypothetical protein